MKLCGDIINMLNQAVMLTVIKRNSDIKHMLRPLLLDASEIMPELLQLHLASAHKDLQQSVVESLGGAGDGLVDGGLELRRDADANVDAKAGRDGAVGEVELEVGELVLLACNVALDLVELGEGLKELVLHPSGGGGVSVRMREWGGGCFGDCGGGGAYRGGECWKGRVRLEGREG